MTLRTPRDRDAPLDAAEFDAAFSRLEGASLVLAAVSGGPDSTALMGGLAAWSAARGAPPIRVAIVDHGLRSGSFLEARGVVSGAAGLGLSAEILSWTGRADGRVSQAAARRARYRLLLAHAREIGASHLATAHTLDDQAETLMLRLASGSGLSGLGGIRSETVRSAVHLVRPLLHLPKSRLVATCRARDWPFVEDPSNADPAFARVRWRKMMPALAAEGLDAERLARLAGRLARADEALDHVARTVFARAARREEQDLVLDIAVFGAEPRDVALRVLGCAVTPREDSPGSSDEMSPLLRLERLETCLDALLGAWKTGQTLRRTLAGHVLDLGLSGILRITREGPRRRGRREAVTPIV